MLKITERGVEQGRDSLIGKFLKILSFQFKHNCAENKEIYLTYSKFPDKEIIKSKYPEYFERHITGVVFSVMIVEACLYDFAVFSKSKTYAEVVSKQALDKEFLSITSELFNLHGEEESIISAELKKLNNVRRHYIHNKSIASDKEASDIKSPQLIWCIEFLYDFFNYLHKINEDYHAAYIFSSFLNQIHNDARGYKIKKA